MLKKLFIIIAAIAIGLGTASGSPEKLAPVETDIMVGEQDEAIPQYPPSEEVNYVLESETVRKMNQAEKAENAKKYDSFGGGITIMAMCIVVGALIVLSILFYIFGNISSWFLTHKKKQTAKAMNNGSVVDEESIGPDSGETMAAIAAALAQHFGQDHDKQDTILTIKRMRKAYSPWNSKIYNMRHSPEVAHNHPQLGKNR